MKTPIRQLKHDLNTRFVRFGQPSKKPICVVAAIIFAFLLSPFPAAAIFGLGDIVFDPSTFAQVSKIWQSDISTYAKITEEVSQLGKIYAQGTAMYDQAKAMAQRIESLKRLRWQNVEAAFVRDETANRYGETADWPLTVNGSSPFAKIAWQTATLLLNNSSDAFLRKELLGSSGNLAALASIEEQDGSAAKCLATIAEYRTAANNNSAAIDALEQDDQNADDPDNSEIGQLNLVDGAQTAGLHEQRSQGALHACLVEQHIIANSWQRNAAAEAMNIFGASQSARNAGESDYGGVADTYYNYVPR